MTFSGHVDRLSNAVSNLEAMGLLMTTLSFRQQTQRYFYKYYTQALPFSDDDSTDIVSYSFDLPCLTSDLLKSKMAQDSAPILPPDESAPVCTSMDASVGVIVDDFEERFIGWYDELLFNGRHVCPGHFSRRDGRYYHTLHLCSKEERESSILWDGEQITEAWDAHSAFFTVLGYYLMYVREYDNLTQETIFKEEARKLLTLTCGGKLYSDIQQFHNSHADYKLTRDEIKNLVQSYKNYARSSLLKKNGELKQYWWCLHVEYVDMYFAEKFPAIRDLFLDYPRRPERDERHPFKMVQHYDGSYGYDENYRMVSNLQRDILPNEFQLISLGLCRDLWERFGIKSVTVHDAIYMKVSDAAKKIDIDALLSRRLGLSSVPIEEKALF